MYVDVVIIVNKVVVIVNGLIKSFEFCGDVSNTRTKFADDNVVVSNKLIWNCLVSVLCMYFLVFFIFLVVSFWMMWIVFWFFAFSSASMSMVKNNVMMIFFLMRFLYCVSIKFDVFCNMSNLSNYCIWVYVLGMMFMILVLMLMIFSFGVVFMSLFVFFVCFGFIYLCWVFKICFVNVCWMLIDIFVVCCCFLSDFLFVDGVLFVLFLFFVGFGFLMVFEMMWCCCVLLYEWCECVVSLSVFVFGFGDVCIGFVCVWNYVCMVIRDVAYS